MFMFTLLYRVDEVLSGHSPTGALVGRDADGRELRLELPLEQARAFRPGMALILQVSAQRLPSLAPPVDPPASATEPRPGAANPGEAPSCGACGDETEEVSWMLGLQG